MLLLMNWDNLDWNNFSCVDMQRRIRSEIAAERGDMSVVEYLRRKEAARNKEKVIAATP